MTHSEKWWKERYCQQNAATNRFAKATTDDEIIEAVADHLIACRSPRHPHRLHLKILNMSKERPVSYDWKYKNCWGISTTDEARARAWVRECMQQGYGVFGSHTKTGAGGGGGAGSLAWIREQRNRKNAEGRRT